MFLEDIKAGAHFKGQSTSTENKQSIDQMIYQHIHVPNGRCIVMLVGPEDGLERHLNAAVQMGLKDLSKLWIIDLYPNIIDQLKTAFEKIKSKFNGTPNFVASDLLAFLKKWNNAENGKIYFVDYDGTSGACYDHINVYEQCIRLDVEYIAIVGSTRTQDPAILKLGKEMEYASVRRRVNVDKATQIRERGKYTPGFTRVKEAPMSAAEILKTYLVDDCGATSILKTRNYKGAGSDSENPKKRCRNVRVLV